jgi:hypothetical protein
MCTVHQFFGCHLYKGLILFAFPDQGTAISEFQFSSTTSKRLHSLLLCVFVEWTAFLRRPSAAAFGLCRCWEEMRRSPVPARAATARPRGALPFFLLALIVGGDHGVNAVQQHVIRSLSAAPALEASEARQAVDFSAVDAEEVLSKAQEVLRFAERSKLSVSSDEKVEGSSMSLVSTDSQATVEPLTMAAVGLGILVIYLAVSETTRT